MQLFLTERVPVAFITTLGLIFSTGWCGVQREQALSHLCVLS